MYNAVFFAALIHCLRYPLYIFRLYWFSSYSGESVVQALSFLYKLSLSLIDSIIPASVSYITTGSYNGTPPVQWQPFIWPHWGRVTHICVGNLTIIGSDNGLSPARRQAIIWTNTGILLIGPLGTNFSAGKRRPSCLGFNVLTEDDLLSVRLKHISVNKLYRCGSEHTIWWRHQPGSPQLTRSSKPVRAHPVPTVTRVITRSSARKEPPEIPWWVGFVRIYCAKLRHLVPDIPSNFHGIRCICRVRLPASARPAPLLESWDSELVLQALVCQLICLTN